MSALSTQLALASGAPDAAILRLLVTFAIEVIGADEGSILLLDASADELVFAMTVGASESQLTGQRMPVGAGLTGLAVATREVQVGAPTYAGVEQAEPRAATGGPTAVIAAPMIVGDEVLGVTTAIRFAAGARFSGADADRYAQVAAIAAVVVHQRRSLDVAAGTLAARVPALEQQLVESISRLADRGPRALAHVATVLRAIEALADTT